MGTAALAWGDIGLTLCSHSWLIGVCVSHDEHHLGTLDKHSGLVFAIEVHAWSVMQLHFWTALSTIEQCDGGKKTIFCHCLSKPPVFHTSLHTPSFWQLHGGHVHNETTSWILPLPRGHARSQATSSPMISAKGLQFRFRMLRILGYTTESCTSLHPHSLRRQCLSPCYLGLTTFCINTVHSASHWVAQQQELRVG